MTFANGIPKIPEALVHDFDELQFEAHGEGHKSSEGDGRTAADIESEHAAEAPE